MKNELPLLNSFLIFVYLFLASCASPIKETYQSFPDLPEVDDYPLHLDRESFGEGNKGSPYLYCR